MALVIINVKDPMNPWALGKLGELVKRQMDARENAVMILPPGSQVVRCDPPLKMVVAEGKKITLDFGSDDIDIESPG